MAAWASLQTCPVLKAASSSVSSTFRPLVPLEPQGYGLPARASRVLPRAMGKKKEKKAKGPGSKSKEKESDEQEVMKPENTTPYTDPDVFLHSLLLIDSYKRATGREMFTEPIELEEAAKRLWEAPFVLISHDGSEDPAYDYGNKAALDLFELDWDGLTAMKSTKSAAPSDEEQTTRNALLKESDERGFVDFTDAVRYTSTGRQFLIKKGTLWTIKDVDGERVGQAAVYSDVEFTADAEKKGSEVSHEPELATSSNVFSESPPQHAHDTGF